MVATPQTIIISGYYGFRNSGDEAVLQSILIALRKHAEVAGLALEPVVLSIDPEWTTATYGVKAVHRMKLGEVRKAIAQSAGLISGGGSLLQDVTSGKTIPYYLGILKLAQWLGKPTFIYAQGIGPVNRKFFQPMIKSIFRKCAYISVRDEQSRQLLQAMGLQGEGIEVVPDPVMGLTLAGTSGLADTGSGSVHAAGGLQKEEGQSTIGISVRYWESSRRELDAIADGLLQACAEESLHLRFLPFHHPTDNEASRYVIERLEGKAAQGTTISLCEDALHPQQMLQEVADCDVLIGMRLHSLIYAAGRRVPLLGVSYDPKIDHFLARLQCRPIGATATLKGSEVATEVLHLLREGQAWRNEREPYISALVEEAGAPARHIVEYLRHKG
ncbi:polysaccharide pyruvyl transferase CsaB [Paenibacillus albidus]|uniref:polysaccharide pyruvyl transferase CsaB n=1 Tax=Paenibacillus albidus TaxID=2041023 RepID=UPI001BEAECEC|nr:polysaccharide pyruvyl transferase CsaB [Paenibacillus albidus]MBT2288273.1 polysaccharide pyruvyl transferase CsaB [Paenibacillus albidus]